MKKSIVTAFLFLCLSNQISAQEFPIFITDQGYIVTEVTLNDSIKANFMLDTAAGVTVLSSTTFGKIEESAEVSGYFTGFRHDGDRIDAEIYELPSVSVGNTQQTDVTIGVYPPLDDYGVEGLIALTYFEDKPFSIDFRNQTLSFVSDDELEQFARESTVLPIRIQRKGGVSLDIFIPVCLNESVKVLAEFDTGSGYGGFLVNPYFIDTLQLDSEESETQQYTAPISGTVLTDTIYPIDSIGLCTSTEGLTKRNATVTFRENLIYESLIGSELFKDRKITIDIPGKRFLIHP